jgi:hypothetical protein
MWGNVSSLSKEEKERKEMWWWGVRTGLQTHQVGGLLIKFYHIYIAGLSSSHTAFCESFLHREILILGANVLLLQMHAVKLGV